MERFIVFAGTEYYPFGGMKDFVGSFADINEAIAAAERKIKDDNDGWAHIVDTEKSGKLSENFAWEK